MVLGAEITAVRQLLSPPPTVTQVVIVSGIASVGDVRALQDANQPDGVALVITDDDAVPSAPRSLAVSATTVTTAGFTATFNTPSSAGKVDGTAGTESNLSYEYRYIRSRLLAAGAEGDWLPIASDRHHGAR